MRKNRFAFFLFFGLAAVLAAEEASSGKAWDIEYYVQTVLAKNDEVVAARETLRQKEIAASNKNILFAGTINAAANVKYSSKNDTFLIGGAGADSGVVSLSVPILPQISVGASYDVSATVKSGVLTVTPAENVSITATVRPFAYDLSKERADTAFASEKVTLAKTMNLLELDARKKYLATISAETSLEIAKKTIENTKVNLDIILLRREQDLQTDADVSQATVDYYDARVAEADAAASAEDARSALSRLAKTDLSKAPLALSKEKIPAVALASQIAEKAIAADFTSSQLNMAMETAKLAYERSQWSWQNLGITLGALLPSASYSGGLSLGLTFSPSMIQDTESASLELSKAKRAVEARQTAVKDAMQAAYRDLELKRSTLEIRQEQSADAARKLAAAKIRFAAGELLKTSMNASELAARTAEAKVEMAQANVWISYYSLLSKASGGVSSSASSL